MTSRPHGRFQVSFRSRTLALAVAILATMMCRASEAQAPPQDPPTDEQQIEIPKLVIPKLEIVPVAPPPNADHQHDKIRAALEGDAPVTDGDPVLDDLLRLIRRRGSVLDGTVLDSSNDFDQLNSNANDVKATAPTTSEDDKAFAAETLLRSARVLSQLGAPDASRRELITRMRQEAAKLLAP